MLDLLKNMLCAAYEIGGVVGVGIIALVFLTLLMYFISGNESRTI